MITHIVSYKLTDPTPENLAAAKENLLSMDGKIPQLRYLEVGLDALKTYRSYDVVLITRFDSWKDYEDYQNHPYHQTVVIPYIRAVVEKSVAVDYEG